MHDIVLVMGHGVNALRKTFNNLLEQEKDPVDICRYHREFNVNLTSITKDWLEVFWHERVEDIVGVELRVVTALIEYATYDSPRTLYVEYPEAYLHPKQQVELGDLAIAVSRKRKSVWKTNSEHMLLRILRRIREQHENEVKKHPLIGDFFINANNVYVIHAPHNYRLRINEEGDFIDYWPDGFFGERMNELL
jgi:hypothetical protein